MECPTSSPARLRGGHFALCNYVGFLSRADAPVAAQELLEVARRVRARFPELAAQPRLIG